MISYSYRLPENETDMTTMAEHDAIMNLMYWLERSMNKHFYSLHSY